MFAFFVSLVLWLGHHHLAELIEVHRARTILIELLKDSLKLLVGERRQQLRDQTPQGVGGDVAQTLLVIHSVG